MKTVVTILAAIGLFQGISLVMLGALYKIQSWEMPTIGGVHFDMLLVGLAITGIGAALLIARLFLPKQVAEDRLELDENRLKARQPIARPLTDEDQYV